MKRTKLALARVNYSQLYTVYDGGKTLCHRDILTPYQLLHLAGYARQFGVEPRVFDGEVGLLTQAQLAREILDWQPDFVGFTATTPDIEATLEACGLIKAENPSCRTIIGGVHASALPAEVAAHRQVDYVVAGDGEEALMRIMGTGRDPQHAGDDGANPSGKIISGTRMDLLNLPMPAHDLLDYEQYPFTDPTRGQMRTASVMSSRGCPFQCNFCMHDPKVRCRSPQAFADEIAYLYHQKGVRYFFVYDDVFLLDRPRVLQILGLIENLGLEDVHFQCQARANLVDAELLQSLKKVGFVRVSLGIESGAEAILRQCNKGVTKENCRRACALIDAHGMEPRASFIVGLPHETRETAMETIEFAKELTLLHANFTVMTPYPGTRVHQMACRGEGLRFTRPEYAHQWSAYRRWGKPIVATDALSAEDLEDLRETAIAEFYTQQKVYDYYESLFRKGNRSSFFYRPLNFAWRRKFGKNIAFWDQLGAVQMTDPA